MSVNKIIIMGRLGGDVEVNTTPNGNNVASLSVACSEQWKDKQGNKQEHTEWMRCVAFGKTGEIIAQYFGKGDMIYLEGKLRTRKWQDKQGTDRYTTEILVDSFQFCGGKNESARSEPRPKPQPKQQPQASGEVFDDDIPF